jgi:hypothetical protein
MRTRPIATRAQRELAGSDPAIAELRVQVNGVSLLVE